MSHGKHHFKKFVPAMNHPNANSSANSHQNSSESRSFDKRSNHSEK